MNDLIAPDIEAKISDLLDDTDFQFVDRRMARFNLFEAVGAVRGELRHSNFLAFLLSPSRSHGLGSVPLLRVLRAILANMAPERRPIRALELVLGDLDGAIVYREWNNIDLLIEITTVELVVLIENKIDAKAGEGQLSRYKALAKSKYPRSRHLFVFLTPEGREADDVDYVSISYGDIAKIIEDLVDDKDNNSHSESNVIIRHYVEMLRRYIVPDEELHELARQLYERHKEAFDFIFDSRPEPENLLGVARALLDSQPELLADRHGANILRFVPDTWAGVSDLNCCSPTAWTKSGRNLLFEIKSWSSGAYADRVIIALVNGPAVAETREQLYSAAAARSDLFKGLVKPMGKQFATIYMRELLTPTAAKNMEHNEKAAAIEAGWSTFLKEELPLLTAAVLDIIGTNRTGG
jgi:PD-(D/E)XK nuclease superfamily